MILFHGTNTDIGSIDLVKCRPNKDFGQGFYLTALEVQAHKMAIRVSRIYGGQAQIIAYEFDETNLSNDNFCVRNFDKPSVEWAMFVINSRNSMFNDINNSECNKDNKYDIVVGPIANDDLALLFRQFSNGFIGVDALVREMEYKKLTNQFSFHTEKAIAALQKAGVYYE